MELEIHEEKFSIKVEEEQLTNSGASYLFTDYNLKTENDTPSSSNSVKDEDILDSTLEQSSEDEKNDDTTCKVCKNTFVNPLALESHIKSRRLKNKTSKCCSCGKSFRDNTQLNVHARKHTGEQPFGCDLCDKKFSVKGNLNKHMSIHTGERRFECSDCDRKFTQLAHLKDHKKRHTGEKPFICDCCNGSFKTLEWLKRHKIAHEAKKPKRSIKCPVCSKNFSGPKQLINHINTHNSDDGLFYCHICGDSCKDPLSLEKHRDTHKRDKSFQCKLCNKAFSAASHLRRHEKSHTGVKPFSCKLCMRAFPSFQNLKRHGLTHSGEKPHGCTECDKRFISLENLTRHKRTHTKEKPYSCDICAKLFAHSTTLKDHRITHSGDKPFGCQLCEKRFNNNKPLYRHIRDKHPEDFPAYKEFNNLPRNMRFQITNDTVKQQFQKPEYVESSEVLNGVSKSDKVEGRFSENLEKCEIMDTNQVGINGVIKMNSRAVVIKQENDEFLSDVKIKKEFDS